MRCAQCDSTRFDVDRTHRDTAETILRQRKCSNCGYKTFTLEVELPPDAAKHSRGKDKMKRLPGFLRIHFS
jgi:transcriptional regulator NrdR family protein